MKRFLPNAPADRSSRRGTAIVETAFVVPIFFVVTLGIAEFGRAFMVSNLLANAVREGARLAIMNGVSSQQVRNAVREQIQSTVGIVVPDENIDVTVTPYPGNPNPNNETANAGTRDLCTVVVRVDYAQVGYVVKFLNGVSLRGQAAMRHE